MLPSLRSFLCLKFKLKFLHYEFPEVFPFGWETKHILEVFGVVWVSMFLKQAFFHFVKFGNYPSVVSGEGRETKFCFDPHGREIASSFHEGGKHKRETLVWI